MATTFGLGFSTISEESQLHASMNGGGGGLSSVSSSSLSNATTVSSPGALAAAAVPSVVPASPSSSSPSLATTVANASASSPPLGSSSSPLFKPSSSSSAAASSATAAAAAAATPYDSHSRLIAGYPRLPGFYGSTYSGSDQASLYSANSAASFYPSLGPHYDLDKANGSGWTSLAGSQSAYSPYDAAHSFYTPYSGCYSTIDSAARRKNATRETTNTLKAWLYEHRKNPYPTKGEKIMLAIITKMTLTQVSTWFANARRRLKKENKMTWEPKNKSSDNRDDSDKDSSKDMDDDVSEKGLDNASVMHRTVLKDERGVTSLDHRRLAGAGSNAKDQQQQLLSNHGLAQSQTVLPLPLPPPSSSSLALGSNDQQQQSHQQHHHQHHQQQQQQQQSLSHQHTHPHSLPHHHHHQLPPFGEGDSLDGQRPKIWSLAHTATSEAASSLAGRLYPEWSAAAAYAFPSNTIGDPNLLLNPFPDPYAHHHHHHHHAHAGASGAHHGQHNLSSSAGATSSSSSSSSSSIQANGSNFYGKPAAAGGLGQMNNWNEMIDANNHQSHAHQMSRGGSNAGGMSNVNTNHGFSPVPFLASNLKISI